ncbi:MAG: rhodanese-like domain-containing protein [Nitrospirota bacterium]
MNTMKKGFVMALAVLFVMAGTALAEQFSDKALKTADEMKNLAGQKVEMPAAMAGVKNITTDELKKMMDEGKAVVILDNRPAKEYEAEHIPTAKRVGVDELLKNGIKEAESAGVNKDDVIVNYCNGVKCWRSPASSTLLLDAGYKNIYWLRDGIPEWIRKGYDTAAGKEAGSWKK